MMTKEEDIIAALDAEYGLLRNTAIRLKIPYRNLTDRIHSSAKLRKVMEDARTQIVSLAEGGIIKKIKEGDGPSIRYVLATMGRSRGWGQECNITVESKSRDEARQSVMEIFSLPGIQVVNKDGIEDATYAVDRVNRVNQNLLEEGV
jgi:hypothetical protein